MLWQIFPPSLIGPPVPLAIVGLRHPVALPIDSRLLPPAGRKRLAAAEQQRVEVVVE